MSTDVCTDAAACVSPPCAVDSSRCLFPTPPCPPTPRQLPVPPAPRRRRPRPRRPPVCRVSARGGWMKTLGSDEQRPLLVHDDVPATAAARRLASTSHSPPRRGAFTVSSVKPPPEPRMKGVHVILPYLLMGSADVGEYAPPHFATMPAAAAAACTTSAHCSSVHAHDVSQPSTRMN